MRITRGSQGGLHGDHMEIKLPNQHDYTMTYIPLKATGTLEYGEQERRVFLGIFTFKECFFGANF